MEQEQHKEEPDIRSSIKGVRSYARSLFAIDAIDYKKATDSIKADVSFRGFNIWILICSILICSLGLNLNSTPVVIGAMLISPLMGPINGLGLAIGTFDRALLRRSLVNIGVASAVSILTAFIFFKITPTGDDIHELFSRKTPVILDLFIAFFGGVAGILAASRYISTNVVPGVAIATALMPPLCTTGYGLATLQMDYVLGAFYLFFMNCVMISIAAVLIVIYLKYPKYSFLDDAKKRKVRNGIIAFVLLLSIPSIILYFNLLQEGKEEHNVQLYMESEFDTNPSVHVDNYKVVEGDSMKRIRVSIKGEYLDQSNIIALENRLGNYGLNDYKLEIVQSGSQLDKDDIANFGEKFKVDILADLYENNEQKLQSKQDEIELLQNELRRINLHNFASEKLSKLVQSQFEIEQFAIDNIVYINEEKHDTLTTALVKWEEGANRQVQIAKLKELLLIQLETDQIFIYSIN